MDLRTVLVDDEQLARDELGYLLGQVGGVEVIGQAGNGVEAIATIERLHPDLVFLDVQMPGLTGFEVARRMLDGRVPAHIIFVTAFDQHAIEAFEVNAVDYLLKPVDHARLELAVERARRRMQVERPAGVAASGVSDADLEKIVQLVAERQNRRERVAIKVGERFMLVQAEEIIYASLLEEGITVVTNQHIGTSNYRTLDDLQERLEHALGGGIGLSNVNERLQTIYGASYHLKLTSIPGEGTCASVEIPELSVPERVTA